MGVTEAHLLGRTLPQADGSWKFIPSRFVEVYEQGGVFLLDEIDAADANVMVAINAALANGVLVTPDGAVHNRHADCLIIAAANTWGRGGDLMYVGRNPLDASTLDRFTLSTLFVKYDEALEADIAASLPDEEIRKFVLHWVWGLRTKITRNRLRRVASTRLVVNATKARSRDAPCAKCRTASIRIGPPMSGRKSPDPPPRFPPRFPRLEDRHVEIPERPPQWNLQDLWPENRQRHAGLVRNMTGCCAATPAAPPPSFPPVPPHSPASSPSTTRSATAKPSKPTRAPSSRPLPVPSSTTPFEAAYLPVSADRIIAPPRECRRGVPDGLGLRDRRGRGRHDRRGHELCHQRLPGGIA